MPKIITAIFQNEGHPYTGHNTEIRTSIILHLYISVGLTEHRLEWLLYYIAIHH